MQSSRTAGRSAFSTPRSKSEYSVCKADTGCALRRLQSNRMLRCRAQLVEDHRLDIERALIDESGAQARLIDQPPEQVEIGIRRQHDVNAAARLEALVGLFKQGCQVPILRPGMPAAVGEIAGLARMLWRT